MRAGDPVDLQAVGGLEANHRRFRVRAIATIDRSGRVSRPRQATLQRTHTSRAVPGVTRPWIQDDRRRTQGCERVRAGDPVDLQAVGGLEAHHPRFRQRAIATIDRSGRVPRPRQATLQRTHTRRTGPARVAGPQRQHDNAGATDMW